MSFRLFVYYCGLCGGGAALAGWALGRLASGHTPLGQAGIKGTFLGMMVALAQSLLEIAWKLAPGGPKQAAQGVLTALAVGAVGGVTGGMAGQALYGHSGLTVFLPLGWAITGLLIGVSLGVFDLLTLADVRPARRKILRGGLGGAAGGALGAGLFLGIKAAWGLTFHQEVVDELLSPSATGFFVLGACIGLSIGTAQVLLEDGWLRIESGFRAGRELFLEGNELTIGRAESCDVGLFGDPGVERLHARILHNDGGYYLVDAGSPGGTFLNGRRINRRERLCRGDRIGVGRSVLLFGERRKR